jgi:hypothetical protein
MALTVVCSPAIGADACLYSNVASAYADSVLAYRVSALPGTPSGEKVWAPFAFRQIFRPGLSVRLREDMREVAKSLGPSALRWRVRWSFGDGTRAAGVNVAHSYRRAGLYKIDVQSYYDGRSRGRLGWYTFDAIDVVVGGLSKDMAWVRATPAATSTADVPLSGTPIPIPTGAAG